jgi:DNA processing protein
VTDERLARAALTRLTEPADLRVARALAQVGAVRLHDDIVAHRAEHGLLADAAVRLETADPQRELEQAERRGVRFVIPGDAEWPVQLDDLAHAEPVSDLGGVPIGLWVRGPLRLDELADSTAIVGSRTSTTYGEHVAREVAAGVARAGHCVVSGAAFGIDQAAHRGALALDEPSVAVLACGVDRPYPTAHRSLIEHMAQVGAVVSELPLGCAPLNTAGWAESLSRPVMGVPGPVTSAQSQGVHHLVRRGAASLVTGPDDVLEVIGGIGDHLLEPPREAERPRDRLTRRHHRVLEAVPVHQPAALASIAATAGVALLEVQTALTYLASRGFVVDTGNGWRLGEATRR